MLVRTASDLVSTAMCYETWSALGWADIKYRYRRTTIGPFWLTLSTAALVGSVGLVFAGLFGNDISQYIPYLGAGIIVWTLINATVLEGCNVFVAASGYIKSVPMPLTTHVYRMIFRNLIIFTHNLLLVIILWCIFQWPLGWDVIVGLGGLAIIVVALIGVVLLLGTLCARFRDIPQIIAALMQLLFLLTPIIWMPDAIKSERAHLVVDWNPLYYLLEVVRGPLLGRPPSAWVWIIAIVLALASFAAGSSFYLRFRHRIAYWL